MENKCFACGKKTSKPTLVTCIDDQDVFVGRECFKLIKKAGKYGYQPSQGGPKLYLKELRDVKS